MKIVVYFSGVPEKQIVQAVRGIRNSTELEN